MTNLSFEAVKADLRGLMVIADTVKSRSHINDVFTFIDHVEKARAAMSLKHSKTSIVTTLQNVCRELEKVKEETSQNKLITTISGFQEDIHTLIQAMNSPRVKPRNVVAIRSATVH